MTNPLKIHYWPERELPAKAQDLVEFDMASIRLVLSGAHEPAPQVWIVWADQYERDGRVLRDSTSPRLLAYSEQNHTLYATDGCNSCVHALGRDLQTFRPDQIEAFARESEIELPFLEQLVAIVAARRR